MKAIVYLTIITLFFGCAPEKKEQDPEILADQKEIKYAEGFTIEQFDNYRLITLHNAWKGEHSKLRYVLYEDEKPKGVEHAVFIKTPIKSIACMSLTHIAFLEKLGLENTVIALSGCEYVSSPKIKTLIDAKLIQEIGVQQNINYELLVDQSPDFVMGYGIDESSSNYINKLKSLGIKVVLNAEYMETHPLGKAEWIKFIAAFYNEDDKAELLFDKLEQNYLNLVAQTITIKQKPTVFVVMPWNGAWYVSGGKSFQAQLFKDAGAKYLWDNNEEKSSLVKSTEVIIDVAIDADYWLNQDSYKSIAEMIGFVVKFNRFNAIKKHNIYNNDNRTNAFSGNDYWESGVINPDIVLKDLIEIFHPEVLEHELYYYRNLK
jgi:iron complex transport system substrate-binding protein